MTSFLDHYELALADVAAGQRVPIPLFPIGEWKSAKYPSLSLTRELADELIAGFDAGVLGTEPVLDSSGNHDTSAPAAGWFKRVYVAPTKDGGEMLFGDAELTDLGAQMLNDGLYKYDSVEIGSVVDNASGAKTDNVFRSATLTNTPVLRMLPPVLDAADLMLAEPVEVALSEVTLADAAPDPVTALLDDMDALAAKLDGALKGKAGMPAMRTLLREIRAKASAHALTEDDGHPVEPTPGSSDGSSQSAKAAEGQPVTLADGSAATKGVDPRMKTVIEALNRLGLEGVKLAEGAGEADVLAGIVKLAEHDAAETVRADQAALQLADLARAKRAGEVEAELAEIETAGNLKPGEKAEFVLQAAENPEVYAVRLAERKALKPNTIVDLSVRGSGKEGDQGPSGHKRVDLEVRDLAEAKLAEMPDGSYAQAVKLVLSENKAGIADRYREFVAGREG